jgi:RHS repeat-associated protein
MAFWAGICYNPKGQRERIKYGNIAEVGLKRYRYTGKEKDEESGLYYHGARYYACWLGRWTAADPAGMVDGGNLYMYCRGNPIRLVDPNGKRGLGSWLTSQWETAKQGAENMETSVGNKNIRRAGYALQHPIKGVGGYF